MSPRAGCPSVWRLGSSARCRATGPLRSRDRRISLSAGGFRKAARARSAKQAFRRAKGKRSRERPLPPERCEAVRAYPKNRLRHEAFCRQPDFSKCRRPETDARFRANRRRLSDSGEAVPAETDRERMRRPKHRHGRRRRRSEAGNPSGTTGRCPFRNVLSWNGLSSRYAPRETTGRRRSGQRCPDCRSNRQPNSIGKRPNG